MVIGVARVSLHIPESMSLKDKRQVMKSLLAQVQREYHLSAAEVDEHDIHRIGVIGLAVVSTEAGYADAMLCRAVAFLENSKHAAQLLDYQTEIIHVF